MVKESRAPDSSLPGDHLCRVFSVVLCLAVCFPALLDSASVFGRCISVPYVGKCHASTDE